jgi:ABC-type dipeptide/oligopeptide/nickel transport system ATPase component
MQLARLADFVCTKSSAPSRPQILLVLSATETFEVDAPDCFVRPHEVQCRKRNRNDRGWRKYVPQQSSFISQELDDYFERRTTVDSELRELIKKFDQLSEQIKEREHEETRREIDELFQRVKAPGQNDDAA